MSRTERAWTAALGVTVVVAAAIRVPGLTSGLWYDEIVTLVTSVRHPVRQIVTELPGLNTHPLYSLLAHASIAAFGESAWSLRLPAYVFGVASVPLAYLLARQLTTSAEAWAAAALLTTSYYHVWFSQDARGYTMLGFFTLASTAALLRLRRTQRPRDHVAYALACIAGIYAHLTMVFVPAGHACAYGIEFVRRGRSTPPPFRTWAAIAAASALAYAPFAARVITVFGLPSSRQAASVATPGWAIGEAARSLAAGWAAPSVLIVAAFAVAGMVSLQRRDAFAVAALVLPGIATFAAIVALGQPLRPRFFFVLSGAAVIFAARGIGAAADAIGRVPNSPARVRLVIVATLVVAAVSAAALPRNYRIPKQDFDGAVQFLTGAEQKGATIAAVGPACVPLTLYYDKAAWPCLRSMADVDGAVAAAPADVLVVYTLSDYIADAAVRARIRGECPERRRFPGTVGGGDIVVCQLR